MVSKTDQLVVMRNDKKPIRYFDINDIVKAHRYRDYMNQNFMGIFSVKRVSEDFPQRFAKATELPQGIFNKEGRRRKSHDVS